MFSSRTGAARLSLIIVIVLIILKVAVAVVTGSISILAQAVDSFLDLFAVVSTLLAVRAAVKPADEEHPWGHGKVENIAAVGQALLIFVAAGLIIYSAVQRITTGATVELTEAGIGVMIVSIIASVFLSRHLLKVSRELDSAALQANAHNIAADVYSAAAVLVGLLIVRVSGGRLSILDPIIAILVALYILRVAYTVLRGSFTQLIDVKLPEEEENVIKSAIKRYGEKVIDFHELRTRKAGSQRYIDLHVVIPHEMHVEEAHDLCDRIEEDIRKALKNASITIHVEPCNETCEHCPTPCGTPKSNSQGRA